MRRYLALLRAVNVGGSGKVAMADLRAVAEALGFVDVATVLQSGSLVFSAEVDAPVVELRFEAILREKLGLSTEVMVRSAEQWGAALAANPFVDEARANPSHLLLIALKSAAKPGAEAALRQAIAGREAIEVAGKLAYVSYPDGVGRSKLTTAVLERHLGTRATGRNWNTVLKIAGLLGS